MKTLPIFTGLFIIGLLVRNALTESKAHKRRVQRQAYLPPSSPSSQKIIREEIITIREEGSRFDESNYGGGKYEIFEVHNHYEPSPSNVADFNTPQYLPPEKEIHVKHIHQSPVPNVNHLDVSSSRYANNQQAALVDFPSGPSEKIVRIEHLHVNHLNTGNVNGGGKSIPQLTSTFRGSGYLPPHEQRQTVLRQAHNAPQFTVPVSQTSHHIANHHQQQQSHHQVQQTNQFKGPDYLPPHQGEQHAHHNKAQHEIQQTGQFSAPDYLPPHRYEQHHQQHHNEVKSQQVSQEQNQLRGPDYLPPHQKSHQQVQQNGQFKGPEYLPPHQGEQKIQHQVQQPDQFRGRDYLPPHQTSPQQTHQHFQQHIQIQGPGYLPPHQNEQHTYHKTHHQIQPTTQFKGPDYLPPHNNHQQTYQQPQTQSIEYGTPDYSLPHQTIQETQHHEHGHQQVVQIASHYLPPNQPNNQPGTLPSDYGFSKPDEQQISYETQPQFQQPLPQSTPQLQLLQALIGSTQLPLGYDFEKPANAEEAIAELHKLPEEDNKNFVVQSQNQQQAQFTTGQQQSLGNYQSNEYLAPQLANTITSNLNQVSPQIFSPAPSTPVQGQLPPARPVQAEQFAPNLHSLSSYMSNVQPNVRYGTQFSASQQPFRDNGSSPPPGGAAIISNSGLQRQQQQHVVLPVAPMYNNQASRSPYYAPAMSYTQNALANSYTSHPTAHQQTGYQYHHHHQATFNQLLQNQHSLQQFMPQNIQQFNLASISSPPPARSSHIVSPASTMSAPPPTSSRIRTVQILGQSSIKTLKVLETSDQSGVKTIKILESIKSPPTGEHQIVKVVTQNSNSPHEHVQTVKIYNDHNDASNGEHNGYLPPAARVVRQSS